MADTIDITIIIKRNGVDVPNFPYRRRLVVDEVQSFSYERATGGGYVSLPVDQMDTLQALVVSADQATTIRLAAQTDTGIALNAGGLLLVVDAAIAAAAATNAKLDNSSGSTTVVSGLGAGT